VGLLVSDAASPHLNRTESFCVEFHHFFHFQFRLDGLSFFLGRAAFYSLDDLVSTKHDHRRA
jgi:hypothetical protein